MRFPKIPHGVTVFGVASTGTAYYLGSKKTSTQKKEEEESLDSLMISIGKKLHVLSVYLSLFPPLVPCKFFFVFF